MCFIYFISLAHLVLACGPSIAIRFSAAIALFARAPSVSVCKFEVSVEGGKSHGCSGVRKFEELDAVSFLANTRTVTIFRRRSAYLLSLKPGSLLLTALLCTRLVTSPWARRKSRGLDRYMSKLSRRHFDISGWDDIGSHITSYFGIPISGGSLAISVISFRAPCCLVDCPLHSLLGPSNLLPSCTHEEVETT